MNALAQDLRYAFRLLRRQPGFAAVAVVTLALGIGATTAVFTVVNGALLRPLPYADPDRLLLLLNGRAGRLSTAFLAPELPRHHGTERHLHIGSGVRRRQRHTHGNGDPQRLNGSTVTGALFQTLGIQPRYGRALDSSDVAENRRVVVLGDGFWRRQFGARPDVIGRTLHLDGVPYEVVGIAPPDVTFPGTPDLWRPLVFTPHNLSDDATRRTMDRRRRTVEAGRRTAACQRGAGSRCPSARETVSRTNEGAQMLATPLQERIVRDIRPALLVLLAAVSLVLLIACVNVANLLLARGGARAREVAVRAAVGAGRGRLIRQFLAESAALGVVGTAAGLLVAAARRASWSRWVRASIPRLADVSIDAACRAFPARPPSLPASRSVSCRCSTTSARFVLADRSPAAAAPWSESARDANAKALVARRDGARGRAAGRRRSADPQLRTACRRRSGFRVRSHPRPPRLAAGGEIPSPLPPSTRPVTSFVQRLGRRGRRRACDSGVSACRSTTTSPASTSFRRRGEPDIVDSPSAGMRVVTPDYFAMLDDSAPGRPAVRRARRRAPRRRRADQRRSRTALLAGLRSDRPSRSPSASGWSEGSAAAPRRSSASSAT